jgi:hypothetical protein
MNKIQVSLRHFFTPVWKPLIVACGISILLTSPSPAEPIPVVIPADSCPHLSAADEIFRDYIQNPPWIKQIHFQFDRNYFVDATDELHPRRLSGVFDFEAAFQPAGYYRKHLYGSTLYDNPPGSKPAARKIMPGREVVSGATARHFWRLWDTRDKISLVPRDGQAGNSSNNWMRAFFDFETADILKARRLGLDKLYDANIKWKSPDEFVASSPKFGCGEGRITSYDSLRRPTTLTYSVSSLSTSNFVVRYEYRGDALFPPSSIVVEDVDTATRKKIVHRNTLEKLVTGLDDLSTDGYHPEQFRRQTTPYTEVTISSNGTLFYVDERAELHPVPTSYQSISTMNLRPRYLSGIAFTAGFGGVACLGVLFVVRHVKRNNQN